MNQAFSIYHDLIRFGNARPKTGFAVPQFRWFSGLLNQRVRDTVVGERLADTGWLDRRTPEYMAGQCASARRTRPPRAPVQTLLMFETFLCNGIRSHGSVPIDTVADPRLALA